MAIWYTNTAHLLQHRRPDAVSTARSAWRRHEQRRWYGCWILRVCGLTAQFISGRIAQISQSSGTCVPGLLVLATRSTLCTLTVRTTPFPPTSRTSATSMTRCNTRDTASQTLSCVFASDSAPYLMSSKALKAPDFMKRQRTLGNRVIGVAPTFSGLLNNGDEIVLPGNYEPF
ncbi:hypothetical protein H4582DRAFT_2131754 [Lactarius indigo]|nr:hypothetical protein H4582DRAFT_2131754 [Lactarius indigo]